MNETPVQRIVTYLETNDFEEYKKMKQWLSQENHPHSLMLGVVSMAPHLTQTLKKTRMFSTPWKRARRKDFID